MFSRLSTGSKQAAVGALHREWVTGGGRCAVFSLTVLFALVTQSVICSANPLVELTLDAPPGCPAPAMVERAIGRLVQHPPTAPLHVSARFVQLPERWQLHASFENGVRTVNGDTCTSVAEALVVMVALAIDPTGTLDGNVVRDLELEEAPAPGATPPEATTAPQTAEQGANAAGSDVAAQPNLLTPQQQTSSATDTAPDVAAVHGTYTLRGDVQLPSSRAVPGATSDPARIGASVALLTASGVLPGWSLGPSVALRYGRRSEWAEFSAAGLLPRFESVGNSSPVGGTISWFGAQAGGCALPFTNLPLGGCLAAEFADLLGHGERVQHTRTAHAFMPAVSAGLVWRSPFRGDFALDARLGFAVLGIRPKLGLQGYGLVFQPDPVSWRGSIGFSWR